MATIGSLVAELSANTASFHRDMGKAVSALNSHSAAMNKSLASISRGFSMLGATIVAVAGPAAIGALIKSQIDAGDQLNKLSQKVGVSVEKLSAYVYAAKLSDVDTQQLSKGLVKLGNQMQDAATNKTGEAARAFAALGINVLDANGKLRAVDSVMDEVGKKFTGAADSVEKTAIASTIYGERIGADLIPMLNQLADLTDEAVRKNQIMSASFAKTSEEFNDEITRMGTSIKMFLAHSESGASVLNGFVNVLKSVQWVALGLAQGFEELGTRIGGLAAAVTLFATGEWSAARQVLKETAADLELIRTRAEGARAALWNDSPSKAAPGAVAQKPTLAGMTVAAKAEALPRGGNLTADEEELSRFRETLMQKYQTMADGFRTQRELELLHNEERRALIAQLNMAEIISDQEKNRLLEEEQLRHQAAMGDIYAQAVLQRRDIAQKGEMAIAQTVFSQMTQMTAGVATHSKTLFEINKISAIANALLHTREAVTSAYKWGAAFGGPALGATMGAIAFAAQMAQVKALRAAKFAGSTSAASVGGGRAVPTTPATDLAQPPQVGGPTGPQITVQLLGSGRYSMDEVQKLLDQLQEAQRFGSGSQIITIGA